MSLPRLVATDLDGTLVRSDETVSSFTRDVLAELDRRGTPVVFVTARPLRWMEEIWPHVGAHGIAIVSNGAILYDVHARVVREVRGIEPADGLPLVARIAAAVPGASFAVETIDGICLDPRFEERYPVPDGTPRGPLGEVWVAPAVKILVRDLEADPEVLRHAVTTAVGERAVATWSVDHLVEISATGVTKATALARLVGELGIAPDEVIAFGDMPNDLAMLTWAGTSYAMANGHADVRACATHVAPTNDDDGVARVLVEVFGLTLPR